MKTKFTAMLLACTLATLSLTGCSSSKTSTTTFTTSVTDESGETTTHTTTTTTENGETSTEEETTTTSADGTTQTQNQDVPYEYDETDLPTLRDEWSQYFEYGAEGKSTEDETVYFTYDDPDNMTQAALMIVNSDNVLTLYDIGPVKMDGDYYVIEDLDGDVELPFLVTAAEDDYFEMTFQDNTHAELYYVDKDTIINDMCSIIIQISGQN